MKRHFLICFIFFTGILNCVAQNVTYELGETFCDSNDKDTIPIKPQSQMLSDVTVYGIKKMVSIDRDRMVYNVRQSPWAKGFNAKDVVVKMPWADPTKPDEVSLVGKKSVIILINEHKINLTGKELMGYLQNIPSESIEKIEIMTSPSPEYSAEGMTGVINIVTKQRQDIGFAGNIGTEYIQHHKASFTEFANLSFSNRLLNFNYSIRNYNENAYQEMDTEYAYPTCDRKSDIVTGLKYDGLAQSLTANVFLSDNMNIGFIGAFACTKNSFDKSSDVTYSSQTIEDASERTVRNGDFHSFSITPYYEWKIDSLGKKLVVNYTYVRNHDKGHQHYTAENVIPFSDSRINSLYVYKCYNVDLKLPFAWMNFETGGECRNYKVNNESEYSVLEEFLYKENVVSAYADINKTLGKWYAKIGARYEYTIQKGYSKDVSDDFTLKYGKLFPFIDITYHPTESSSVVFGYSKRIERPAMWCLDPTRSYTDSYHYEAGNPKLNPTMMDYLELKYMFNNLYVELSYVYTDDGIVQIFDSKDGGVMSCGYANGIKIHSLGGNANYTFNYKKLSTNIGGAIYYNKSKSTILELTDNNLKGFSSRLSGNVAYSFRENITAFADYYYVFSGLSQNVHTKSFHSLSMGANMRLLKDKLVVEIGARDILGTIKSQNRIDYKDFTFSSKINNDVRSLYIKFSYRFGNNKVRYSNVDINQGDNRIPSSR